MQTYAGIKVIAEVLINTRLLWDITSYRLVNINRRYTEVAASIFGGLIHSNMSRRMYEVLENNNANRT